MKHMANEEMELNLLREALELKEVPAAVNGKLRQVYAELPERPAPQKRGLPRGLARGLSVGAVSAAAALVMLFGANFAFPAFAESLPGIGRVFENINRSSEWSYNGKTVEGLNLGTYETEAVNLSAENAGSRLTVVSAYSDGSALSLAMKLEVPEEIREQVSPYFVPQNLRVTANGEELSAGGGKNGLVLWDDYKSAYTGAVTFNLPAEAADGDVLQVGLHVDDLGGKGKMTKDWTDAPVFLNSGFDLDFAVTVNAVGGSFSADAESGGAKLIEVLTSPTQTKLTVSLPAWKLRDGSGWYSADPVLYLMDGEKIRFNLSKSTDEGGYYPWGDKLPEQTCDLYFDGLPANTEQFVLRFVREGTANSYSGPFPPAEREAEVKAEFTVDLKNGTAAASSHWQEEGALNVNSPFDYDYLNSAYVPYDHSMFVNGLYASGMYFCNPEKYWSLSVVTDQPYRELKAELLSIDGSVRETAFSVNEPTNASYVSGFYDERTEWFGKFNPNNDYAYTIVFHEAHYQPAVNETITVRLSDAETGEVLAEQSLLMSDKST